MLDQKSIVASLKLSFNQIKVGLKILYDNMDNFKKWFK
jgi:hypothetical protein